MHHEKWPSQLPSRRTPSGKSTAGRLVDTRSAGALITEPRGTTCPAEDRLLNGAMEKPRKNRHAEMKSTDTAEA